MTAMAVTSLGEALPYLHSRSGSMLNALIKAVLVSVFTMLAFIFMLDWIGGCGEMFTYADGSQHSGECMGQNTFKTFIKEHHV